VSYVDGAADHPAWCGRSHPEGPGYPHAVRIGERSLVVGGLCRVDIAGSDEATAKAMLVVRDRAHGPFTGVALSAQAAREVGRWLIEAADALERMGSQAL
jgi:hypothetical protein